MPKKIILLCAVILRSTSTYGLHEIFQTTFQQHLQHAEFEEARKLVADEAFPEEKDELLAQITRAEIARRDLEEAEQILHARQEPELDALIAQKKYSEAVALLVRRGLSDSDAKSFVKALRQEYHACCLVTPSPAGPSAPERASRARSAPATSSASMKSPQALYKQLEAEYLEKIYDALMENDEDLALAVLMSANIGYEDAHAILNNILLPDFRAKHPRRPEPTPAEADKEKVPNAKDAAQPTNTTSGSPRT